MNAEEKQLKNFLNPRSVALVGATEKKGKVGNAIAKNILELGYSGKVFLVNPKHETLFGQKCYSALEEISDNIDLAIIAIPASFVNETILKAADKVKNFVIISAGFSEIGPEGKKREEALGKIATENKLLILGPNCLGFINPKIKLNASFAGGIPKVGGLSFISQSGALAVATMDIARKESIGFSDIISIGNKIQLDETNFLKYAGSDEKTRVVGMYIEGIKNGKEFLKIGREVCRRKPVVILKSGRTERSQKAIASHTGALAGSDKIIQAVFEKLGIIRAKNLDNFFDLAKLILNYPAPKNNQAVVITNAGGPGVLAADAFKGKKIKLAEISPALKEKLKSFLPEESSLENPIDLLGDAQKERYRKALEILDGEEADTIICVLTPQDQTPTEKIAEAIAAFGKKSQKIITAVFIGGKRIEEAVKILNKNGIPNFSSPWRAIWAIDQYYRWNKKREEEIPSEISLVSEKKSRSKMRRQKVLNIIKKAKRENRRALLFEEAGKVMEIYQIPVIPFSTFKNDKKITPTGMDFPLALKVDSDKVLHKTDRQGVILNIKNENELESAVFKMRQNFPKENIVAQPMRETQNELILGIKRDETFGPVAVFGLGGIYTEIFQKADFIIPPVGKKEIEQKISNSELGFLFRRTRGKNPCNLNEFSGILERLITLAEEIPEIKELDINPILLYNDGRKSEAVDVKIIIR